MSETSLEKSQRLTQSFNALKSLEPDSAAYLHDRGIAYGEVKDIVKENNGSISCKILGFVDDGLGWVNYQSRSITERKFRTQKDHEASGVFVQGVEPGADVYVVEGLFDFLSLRQYTPNVIGLFNASSEKSIEVLISVIKAKSSGQVYFIPDEDEAGYATSEKIKSMIDDVIVFKDLLHGGEYKDINDICSDGVFDFKTFSEMLEEEKFRKHNYKITSGIKFRHPVQSISEDLGHLFLEEFSVFVGTGGSGKTTYLFKFLQKAVADGHKICFMSYEEKKRSVIQKYYRYKIPGMHEALREALVTREMISEIGKRSKNDFPPEKFTWVDRPPKSFEEVDRDIRIAAANGSKLIVIDHLTKLVDSSREYSSQGDISMHFSELVRDLGIHICLIHHTNKEAHKKGPIVFKGSGSIYDNSDNFMYLSRPNAGDEDCTDLERASTVISQTKNRGDGELQHTTSEVYFHKGEYYESSTDWRTAKDNR